MSFERHSILYMLYPKEQVELSLFLLLDADNTDNILLASHFGTDPLTHHTTVFAVELKKLKTCL